jgi:hypothetical protein
MFLAGVISSRIASLRRHLFPRIFPVWTDLRFKCLFAFARHASLERGCSSDDSFFCGKKLGLSINSPTLL